MVRTLRLQTTREMRDFFLCMLMFKCIHGHAHYLCNDVTIYVDINGYDTRTSIQQKIESHWTESNMVAM